MAIYEEVPFNSGDVVAGKVVGITDRFALINALGWELPLDTRHITWDVLRNPAERLSLGNRLELVVQTGMTARERRQLDYPCSDAHYGFWLSRLPLLENPWPALRERYQDGSVVEVEFIDYLNWYIGRVRMPEGLIIELRTNDIHPSSKRSNEYARKLQPGERFRVVFRRIYPSGGWVERFMGCSKSHHLAESGFVTPRVASKMLDAHERSFLADRERRYS